MDKEISNLQEQKNALSEITNQREYENKLIEAKLKLENAQKEKKRVWREGVGWVYEADQSAVAEAQKELDNLDTQKKISEIDLQTTQLEADKKMLSDISREEELAQQKAQFDAWVRKYNETSGSLNRNINSQFYAALVNPDSTLNSTIVDMGELIADWKARWVAQEESDEEARRIAWEAFTAAETEYNDAEAAYKANNTDTNRARLTTARQNYNTALNNWQTAYTNSQNKGYTSAASYTQTDKGLYSTYAADIAKNGVELYDKTEEWWLPN